MFVHCNEAEQKQIQSTTLFVVAKEFMKIPDNCGLNGNFQLTTALDKWKKKEEEEEKGTMNSKQ